MNKLFAFLTLCGLAAFMTGCGEEKPATPTKPIMPQNMPSGNVPGAMNPNPPEDKGAATDEAKPDENAADANKDDNKDDGADEKEKEE